MTLLNHSLAMHGAGATGSLRKAPSSLLSGNFLARPHPHFVSTYASGETDVKICAGSYTCSTKEE